MKPKQIFVLSALALLLSSCGITGSPNNPHPLVPDPDPPSPPKQNYLPISINVTNESFLDGSEDKREMLTSVSYIDGGNITLNVEENRFEGENKVLENKAIKDYEVINLKKHIYNYAEYNYSLIEDPKFPNSLSATGERLYQNLGVIEEQTYNSKGKILKDVLYQKSDSQEDGEVMFHSFKYKLHNSSIYTYDETGVYRLGELKREVLELDGGSSLITTSMKEQGEPIFTYSNGIDEIKGIFGNEVDIATSNKRGKKSFYDKVRKINTKGEDGLITLDIKENSLSCLTLDNNSPNLIYILSL